MNIQNINLCTSLRAVVWKFDFEQTEYCYYDDLSYKPI